MNNSSKGALLNLYNLSFINHPLMIIAAVSLSLGIQAAHRNTKLKQASVSKTKQKTKKQSNKNKSTSRTMPLFQNKATKDLEGKEKALYLAVLSSDFLPRSTTSPRKGSPSLAVQPPPPDSILFYIFFLNAQLS